MTAISRPLLEALPSAAILTDTQFRILDCNRMAGQLLEYEAPELLHSDLQMLLASERDAEVLSGDPSCALNRFEVQWVRKGGQPFRAEAARSLVTDGSGQRIGFLLVLSNPTERLLETLRVNQLVLECRESERRALAEKLHDSILQELIAIGFSLAHLQRRLDSASTDGDSLPGLQQRVIAMIRRIRALVASLRPTALEVYGLSASIEALADRAVREHSNGQTQVRLDLDELPIRSLAEQLCLFHAAQEALLNSLRHARSSNILISLKQVRTGTRLRIKDDGIGFDVPGDLFTLVHSQRYGLAGLAEQTRLSNGEFSVRSSPGRGTCVEILLRLVKAL
ncbi:MAG: ATP-binding protein [Vulcanimicrobiota bacterium]